MPPKHCTISWKDRALYDTVQVEHAEHVIAADVAFNQVLGLYEDKEDWKEQSNVNDYSLPLLPRHSFHRNQTI